VSGKLVDLEFAAYLERMAAFRATVKALMNDIQDGRLIVELPDGLSNRKCDFCGRPVKYAVGEQLSNDDFGMSNACEDHLEEAKRKARGENVIVNRAMLT
jgi:hypothetical protein